MKCEERKRKMNNVVVANAQLIHNGTLTNLRSVAVLLDAVAVYFEHIFEYLVLFFWFMK